MFLVNPWFLLFNFLLGVLMIEWALKKTKVVRNVKEERDSKFPAFRRIDVQHWTRKNLYPFAILVPLRFFTCIFQVLYHLPLVKLIIALGEKPKEG